MDHERGGGSGSQSGSGTGHAGDTATSIPARPPGRLQGAWQSHHSFQLAPHSCCSAGTGTMTLQGLDGGPAMGHGTDVDKTGGSSRQRGAKSDPSLIPAWAREAAAGPCSLRCWWTPPSPGSSWRAGPAARIRQFQKGFSSGSWHSTGSCQRLPGWKCH